MRNVVNMQINGAIKAEILKDAKDHCMTISKYVIWLCEEERKRFSMPRANPDEIWKPIEGYEGIYEVSTKGRIRTLRTNKIVTPKNIKGYSAVRLYKNGKDRQFYIHRIVAKAFIPNPLELQEVNHKDENTKNNNLNNLEWCDRKYNANYGTAKQRSLEKRLPLMKRCKTVQKDESGKIIAVYNSIKDAAEQTGFKRQNIQSCCAGKQKRCHGYIFEYLTDDKAQEES